MRNPKHKIAMLRKWDRAKSAQRERERERERENKSEPTM
jgi:hypothetical protein